MALCVGLLCGLPTSSGALTLNDSGQTACSDAETVTGSVVTATPDPETSGFDGQDCTRGRAAADALGVLPKTGDSLVPGRDYLKIANNGEVLAADATLGEDADDWACTRDLVTGLTWEIKLDDATHLRHRNHRYSWYDSDGNRNGGHVGWQSGFGGCGGTLTDCNTEAFVAAVNAAGLCGADDWRLPTREELLSLTQYGEGSSSHALDLDWFPNPPSSTVTPPQNPSPAFKLYWTASSSAFAPENVWYVHFGSGAAYLMNKNAQMRVRLVRGAP